MLKGVIFDMDGVIIDNNAFHELAWVEFCKSYGVILTSEEIQHQIFGRIARDTLEYIFKKKLSREEVDFYVEKKEKIYKETYSKFIKPSKGLISFIENLKSNKIKLGMATSAPPGNVEYTLRHIPVRDYFDIILDGDSVTNGKPHPDIYLKTIRELNLIPSECVIFEDSIPGIQAGIASGAHVVGMATTHKKSELKEVNWVINDFTEVSMEYLLKITGSIE